MGFLDKMKNLFTDEVEEPVKSEMIQVEIPAPAKEEVVMENTEIKKEEVSTPIFFDDDYFKELEQPKREVKSSYIKEAKSKDDKKQFKPTPIISPVYGVLDKNYNKEDIRDKNEKIVYHTNTSVSIDDVRKKAYGTLEDELENTLFGNNSILFNDEVEETLKENKDDDLFDELTDDSSLVIDILDESADDLVEEHMAEEMTSSDLFDLIDTMYEKGDE